MQFDFHHLDHVTRVCRIVYACCFHTGLGLGILIIEYLLKIPKFMEVLSLVICMAAYPENASKNFVPFSFPKITLCQIGAKSRVAIYSTFKISSIRTSFGKSFWKTVSCWKNRGSAALSSSLEICKSYISAD